MGNGKPLLGLDYVVWRSGFRVFRAVQQNVQQNV
jgi:hypothetical protein